MGAGPASKVKRPSSPSTDDETTKKKKKDQDVISKDKDATKISNDGHESVKKKVKAGPKSRVKRERSLGSESETLFRKVMKLDEDKESVKEKGNDILLGIILKI